MICSVALKLSLENHARKLTTFDKCDEHDFTWLSFGKKTKNLPNAVNFKAVHFKREALTYHSPHQGYYVLSLVMISNMLAKLLQYVQFDFSIRKEWKEMGDSEAMPHKFQ